MPAGKWAEIPLTPTGPDLPVFRATLVKPFGSEIILHSHQWQLSGMTGTHVLFYSLVSIIVFSQPAAVIIPYHRKEKKRCQAFYLIVKQIVPGLPAIWQIAFSTGYPQDQRLEKMFVL
jgi:hypothetical protein